MRIKQDVPKYDRKNARATLIEGIMAIAAIAAVAWAYTH